AERTGAFAGRDQSAERGAEDAVRAKRRREGAAAEHVGTDRVERGGDARVAARAGGERERAVERHAVAEHGGEDAGHPPGGERGDERTDDRRGEHQTVE